VLIHACYPPLAFVPTPRTGPLFWTASPFAAFVRSRPSSPVGKLTHTSGFQSRLLVLIHACFTPPSAVDPTPRTGPLFWTASPLAASVRSRPSSPDTCRYFASRHTDRKLARISGAYSRLRTLSLQLGLLPELAPLPGRPLPRQLLWDHGFHCLVGRHLASRHADCLGRGAHPGYQPKQHRVSGHDAGVRPPAGAVCTGVMVLHQVAELP
jgi:hypothetical protein